MPTHVDTVMHYLATDHDHLDDTLDAAAVHLAAGDHAAAAADFAVFTAGLTRHIRLEESLLFPQFERITGMASGPTSVMRHEHRHIERILGGLGSALAARDAAGFNGLHAELLAVLGPHNDKEEAIIYPMTDEALDDEARHRLVAELRAFA